MGRKKNTETEIITPVEKIETVEEQDVIGQAWADLCIPPDEPLPPLTPAEEQSKHEGMKLNPEYIEKYIEKKTKRVQLVFQPSIYEAAKDRAAELHTSLNDYLQRLIKADLQNKPNTNGSTPEETAADSAEDADIILSFQYFRQLLREKMHCQNRIEEINEELLLYRDTCNSILIDLKSGGMEA